MSQRMMVLLFGVKSNTITYHLGEIYKIGELGQVSTTRKIRVVQKESTRNIDKMLIESQKSIAKETEIKKVSKKKKSI